MMSVLQSSIPRHRLRVLGLAVVLLAFDVAFVAALYVLGHVAVWLLPLVTFQLPEITWSLELGLVPLWPVRVVGTPLTLLVQSVFGYRLTLRDVKTGAVGPEKSLKNVLLADRSDDGAPDERIAALQQRQAALESR